MDLTTDYFDASHFNCRGAEKVTRLYGDLLAESGLLSDKRSNPPTHSGTKILTLTIPSCPIPPADCDFISL